MRSALIYTVTLSLAFSTSCTDEGGHRLDEEQLDADRDVGPEERQAARALSLIDSGQITAIDPYEKARQCSVAIGVLTESVEGLGTFTPEQIRVLDDARAVYDRRMRLEASGSEQPPPSTPEAQEQENSQTAEQARGAIACLRELGLQ